MKKQKRILNEQTTRKFMKLAGLQPLSENFFSNTIDEQEDELEDELPPEGPADELPPEEPMDELPPEVPMDVGPEGGDVDVHSLVDAIAAAIEQETGVTVDVEGDEAPGEEAPLPDDEELDLEAPPEDEAPADDAPPEDDEPVIEAEESLEETITGSPEDEETVAEDTLEEDAVDERRKPSWEDEGAALGSRHAGYGAGGHNYGARGNKKASWMDEGFDKAGIVLENELDEARLNEMTARVAARILELAKKNK